MNRFKFKNLKIKNILIVLSIFLLIYIHIYLFINTGYSKYIISKINSKYNIRSFNIKQKLLDSSLSKIVVSDTSENEEKKIIEVDKSNEKTKTKYNPIIYIYNTHESEKYSLPYVSDYSITPDVRLASYILKDYLNDYKIDSFVQTKSIKEYLNKHNLDYTGSYEASREYMKEELKNHNYKILIDLHRDSVKHKYTLYESDGVKYAKIMFVLTTKHKNYKKNEEFVNNLNDRIKSIHKGLSRGIMIRNDVIFNQDLSDKAILIELGGVDNTLEEINNTLEILAKVINDYIKEEL